jgi:deoxyadenosine/deoxycytidine kinase
MISKYFKIIEFTSRHPDDILCVERSPINDKMFADILFEDGFLTPLEHTLYINTYICVMKALENYQCFYKYIDSTPTECATRIQKRNRAGEVVNLVLLDKLDAKLRKHYE